MAEGKEANGNGRTVERRLTRVEVVVYLLAALHIPNLSDHLEQPQNVAGLALWGAWSVWRAYAWLKL